MLPQTFAILLLLSAAASLSDSVVSAGDAEKTWQRAGVVGGLPQQKRSPAAKQPLQKAQGQGTQNRRPARAPAQQRQPGTNSRLPWRGQQRPPPKSPPQIQQTSLGSGVFQPPQAAGYLSQNPPYVICYLYPETSPQYQNFAPRPLFVANSGVMYPRNGPHKTKQPDNAGNRAPRSPASKMFGPAMGYPGASVPHYARRIVCPLYQPMEGAAAVPSWPTSNSDNSYSGYKWIPNHYVLPVQDSNAVVPDLYYVFDEESPLSYSNPYGSPGPEPEGSYPAVGYGVPPEAGYQPTFPFTAR